MIVFSRLWSTEIKGEIAKRSGGGTHSCSIWWSSASSTGRVGLELGLRLPLAEDDGEDDEALLPPPFLGCCFSISRYPFSPLLHTHTRKNATHARARTDIFFVSSPFLRTFGKSRVSFLILSSSSSHVSPSFLLVFVMLPPPPPPTRPALLAIFGVSVRVG